MTTVSPSKICVACGRTFTWRKKWARDWDSIRYCSKRCRSQRVSDVDRALERTIMSLLETRARGATICPSEAARKVAMSLSPEADEWRSLMEPARAAARRLVAADEVEITQKGSVVDPSTAKGPIRIRRVNS